MRDIIYEGTAALILFITGQYN